MNPTLRILSVFSASAQGLPFGTVVQILGVLGVLAVNNALSDDAAAMSEPTAAHVKLQRLSPVFPPAHCDNAAALRELPACTFGGSFANYAIYAN